MNKRLVARELIRIAKNLTAKENMSEAVKQFIEENYKQNKLYCHKKFGYCYVQFLFGKTLKNILKPFFVVTHGKDGDSINACISEDECDQFISDFKKAADLAKSLNDDYQKRFFALSKEDQKVALNAIY